MRGDAVQKNRAVQRSRSFGTAGTIALGFFALAAFTALSASGGSDEPIIATYSCSSDAADQAAYGQIQLKMQDLNRRRAAGEDVEDQVSAALKRNGAITECFENKGKSPGVQNYNRFPVDNPSPGPSPTATTPTEAEILDTMLNDMQARSQKLLDDQRELDAILDPFKKLTALGSRTQLDYAHLQAEYTALQAEIEDMKKQKFEILSGASPANLTCEAVCSENEEKTAILLADTRCNAISQCRDCRVAFMSSLTAGASTSGPGADATGRIGVIGNTCLGYKAALGYSAALLSASERWRHASDLCDQFFGNFHCTGDMLDAAHGSNDDFLQWSADNKALLSKAGQALKDLVDVSPPSPTINKLTNLDTGFFQELGTILNSHMAAVHARILSWDALKTKSSSDKTGTEICGAIKDYTAANTLGNNATSACTVYTGYLLQSRKGLPGASTPAVVTIGDNRGKGDRITTGRTSTGENGGTGALIARSSDDNLTAKCGNLKGAACDAYLSLTAKSAGNGDDPSKFTKLASTVADFAAQNPKATDRFNADMNTLTAKENENLPLGDRYASIAPMMSKQSRDVLNQVDRSMESYLKKKYPTLGNSGNAVGGGGTLGSAGSGPSGPDLASPNKQDLQFGTANGILSGIDISPETGVSLFARINQATLRKQRTMEVALYPPLLARNRAAAFGDGKRMPASEKADPTAALLFKGKSATAPKAPGSEPKRRSKK